MRRLFNPGKGRRSMDVELAGLRVGVLTPEDFVRRTFGDWTALGQYLAGRWEIPPALDAEDTRQEMLLALLEEEAVTTWDPTREIPLSRYVVWNTCATTKQWLHQQRGALRWSGKARSRFPVAFAMLGVEDGHEPQGVADAEQEARTGAREMLNAIERRLSGEQVQIWRLLQACGGDRAAAAAHLTTETRDEATARDAVAATIAAARKARREIET